MAEAKLPVSGQSPPKSPAGAAPAAPKKKAKTPSFSVVLNIILLLAITAFAALVYFDIGGLKTIVSGVLRLEIPTQAQLDEVQAAQQNQQQRDAELTQKAQEQDSRESQLVQREQQATDRQTEQDARQAVLDAQESALNERQVDAEAMIILFSQMDPVKAAAALAAQQDISDIAWVLARMDAEQAAQIMNQFDTQVAAQVAARMIESGAQTPAAPAETAPAT